MNHTNLESKRFLVVRRFKRAWKQCNVLGTDLASFSASYLVLQFDCGINGSARNNTYKPPTPRISI